MVDARHQDRLAGSSGFEGLVSPRQSREQMRREKEA